MREHPAALMEGFRCEHPTAGASPAGARFGAFQMGDLFIIASDGWGWDHVSVSTPNGTPAWVDMCAIKDLFWEAEETVIQFHPKRSEYVNLCGNALHLWKKQGGEHELPPQILTGPREE